METSRIHGWCFPGGWGIVGAGYQEQMSWKEKKQWSEGGILEHVEG